MGVIVKQSIKGSVFSYLGIIIGFVTSALIIPNVLAPQQIGLLKLLVSYSSLFGIFAGLGFMNVTVRFFTYFKDEKTRHNGFFLIAFLVNTLGIFLFIGLFLLLKPFLIEDNIDKSELFIEYMPALIPLTVFTVFFNSFDAYYRVLMNASRPIFAKEFLWRVLVLILLALYYFEFVTVHGFVVSYCVVLCVPTVYLLFFLLKEKQLSFHLKWPVVEKGFIKSMIGVSLSAIFTGYSAVLVIHVDALMINSFLGLAMTGIYTTVFFFGTLISVPSRNLKKIAATVIADAWKVNDRKKVYSIYKRSVDTQSVIGAFLFMGIWVNNQNILFVLPEEFAQGVNVILFIGLANLVDMFGGVNITVISLSKKYMFNAYLMVVLVASLLLTNYIFIPIYGITGAAIASLVSVTLFNFLKFLVIHHFYGMQPYNFRHIYLLLFLLSLVFVNSYIPTMPHFLVDFFVRSSILSIIYLVGIYKLQIAMDINEKIDQLLFSLKLKR